VHALSSGVGRKDDFQIVGRPEEQLATDAEIVEVVEVAPFADAVDRAVALGARERQPRGQVVRNRAGRRRLGLDEAVIAIAEFELRLRHDGRLACGDVDGAGRGVLAEQRALRPAQDLDPFEVEEVHGGRARPGEEDAIDVKADAGVETVIGKAEWSAETADVD